MKSLWNDAEAATFEGPLGPRVYTSRLLGRDKSLVLHGGGNTSVKLREPNKLGVEEELLYVKGSGWDLEFIEAAGFAPVRLQHLIALAGLDSLSDPEMVNELRTHMTNAAAPTPSVEAILHAILPYAYVDHTHSDALIAVSNTDNGTARLEELYGDDVVIIPYIMPGFDLARDCARLFAERAGPATQGMVLEHHGLFSFGATARESYERMIALADRAERYLDKHKAWSLPTVPFAPPSVGIPLQLAALRQAISAAAGAPMIVMNDDDPAGRAFAQSDAVATLSQQGPATPDHVIRTKRVPMLGRDVDAFVTAYREYYQRHAHAGLTMLDPAPRVILDPEWGLCCAGRSAGDAAITRDIYLHTIEVILRATALGGYRALPEADLFAMEYWDLEQAKLRRAGKPPAFTGEIALVTGAASGIGKACVEALLAQGAAVIGLDIDTAVMTLSGSKAYLGVQCDVTQTAQLDAALAAGVRRFGGLDMLVINAGVFPPGCRIESLTQDAWRKVMAVNLDANLDLMRLAQPLLKLAPRHGRVVVIGSRNVTAPGAGAAAYSASKAALNQLARIAALEWAADGIRVNTLHPDCVYDTGIWTPEVLAARARHYGLTVDEYKTRNLLKTEVASHDVAALACALCGELFAKTTGAQVPVDGGSDRVI